MDVREKLNEKPGIGIGITVGAVVIAVVVVFWQFSDGSGTASDKAFYTNDDGATYFRDDVNRVVPFERDGRLTYRAWVYQCGDGQPFVAYIGRYNDQGRREIEQYIAEKPKDPNGWIREAIEHRGMEIRRVGADDRSWVLKDAVAGDRLLMTVRCGSGDLAQPMLP